MGRGQHSSSLTTPSPPSHLQPPPHSPHPPYPMPTPLSQPTSEPRTEFRSKDSLLRFETHGFLKFLMACCGERNIGGDKEEEEWEEGANNGEGNRERDNRGKEKGDTKRKRGTPKGRGKRYNRIIPFTSPECRTVPPRRHISQRQMGVFRWRFRCCYSGIIFENLLKRTSRYCSRATYHLRSFSEHLHCRQTTQHIPFVE